MDQPARRRSPFAALADERGGGAVEYAAVIGVVATVVGSVMVAGVPERVGGLVGAGICDLLGGEGCEEAGVRSASGDRQARPGAPSADPGEDGGEEEAGDSPRCEGSWPDLVGMDADEAMRLLQEEDPGLSVSVVPEGTPATADFQCGRVRLSTDPDDGTVISAPSVG
ncbi:serine protease inhibitor [Nocardiopsis composta]|uniref:Flp pilus assembly pilin Flp n=1 Tax=Nocardiopsis composta TaxID=157465 RepID=A0A7W8VHI8_9ACTN|nr:serine protease inhibitor [Nocardiopsis composta]MBB5436268.1 Flp pilus assembly pilin Flp [Nocardiopsis composta]